MPPWYYRSLPCQTGLSRATTHLENARNTKDQTRAKNFCDKAKESLERIKVSHAGPLDLDQIIAKYREHGAVLEKWQYGVEAWLSYSKANELRYELRRFENENESTEPCASSLTNIYLAKTIVWLQAEAV
jgi:hypothetical protein